ncbi:hypothetical protein ACEPAH_7831 [Sanghuangporus vaninii]
MSLGTLSDPYLGENVPGTSLLGDLHARGSKRYDAFDPNVKRERKVSFSSRSSQARLAIR